MPPKTKHRIVSEGIGSLDDLQRQPKSFIGNPEHLKRFIAALHELDGESWNEWRKSHPKLKPDLRGLDLTVARGKTVRISHMNLSGALLSRAQLTGVHGWFVELSDADLSYANLDDADLSFSFLIRANLEHCRLLRARLTEFHAEGANFRYANLSNAMMNGAFLEGADLRSAKVVGISTWEVHMDAFTQQEGLVLEELGDFIEDLVDSNDDGIKERIQVRANSIEAAYLLYLIRDKRKLKTVIDAMTDNLVLILGNFSRKPILDSISQQLAKLCYTPVVFDFEAPVDRDLIETVAVLAGLSCFLIVDLTQPVSTPLETMLIAPQLGVPFASIIQKGEKPFSMFSDLHAKYSWVLPTWTYSGKKQLVRELETAIVKPCERKRKQLRRRRIAALRSFARRNEFEPNKVRSFSV